MTVTTRNYQCSTDYAAPPLLITPRNPAAVTAFEIGRATALFDWYAQLAALTGSKHHHALATTVIRDIDLSLVAIEEKCNSSLLRRKISSVREDWEGLLESEWFAELWWANHVALTEDAAQHMCESDLLLAPRSCGREILEILRQGLEELPTLLSAIQLGRFIQQGAAPIEQTLDTLSNNPYSVERPTRLSSPDPQMPNSVVHWLREAKFLWEANRLIGEFPHANDQEQKEVVAFRRFVNELIGAARQELGEEKWPPNDGWHVREGSVAFRWKAYTFSQQIQQFVSLLVNARRPPTSRELARALWNDDPEADTKLSKLQELKCRVNTQLKAKFQLTKDPITTSNERGWDRKWFIEK